MRFEAGTVFAGYTIVSRLGRGGMATVYLAREPGLDRLVALKVLPEQLVDDAQFAARFEQEAKLIAGLDHPNIIPLYRYGIADDVPWMALRYVDGGDFASRLNRPLPVPEGLSLLRGVASALDYAHRKGVIHRDLKPQNILLSGDASAYLADFGVAKMLEGSFGLKTATGGVMGTPAYMAPEQTRGLQLGPFTDVYALAVICFQWLTGNLPFDADTPQAILMKHALDPLPADALRSLSPRVAAVIQRGLAKRPEDRFQSATTLIDQLENALLSSHAPELSATRAPPSAETAARTDDVPTRSGHLRNAIALGALALVIAGYAYWRESATRSAPPPTPAQPAIAKPAEPLATTPIIQPTPDNKQPAIAPTPEPTATATLIVKTDSDCRLAINSFKKGPLQADKVRTFKVNPGEQLIECIDDADPKARAAETRTLTSGEQAVVVLALAQKVSGLSASSPKEEAAPPSSAHDEAFSDIGGGILKNVRTGLEWSQRDNGADTDWNTASAYCAAKGGNWRLPDLQELGGIFDTKIATPNACATIGTVTYACKTSPLFRLTSTTFWSATSDGPTQAWQMNLVSGSRDRVPVGFAHDARALCVRQR